MYGHILARPFDPLTYLLLRADVFYPIVRPHVDFTGGDLLLLETRKVRVINPDTSIHNVRGTRNCGEALGNGICAVCSTIYKELVCVRECVYDPLCCNFKFPIFAAR